MFSDFDIASQDYDRVFTNSNIGKAQRNKVYTFLNPILKQEMQLSILELNCGTGEDAIYFSNFGHQVIATDVSQGMITVAKSKKKSNNVVFKVQDIKTISKQSFATQFDLVFSNFGGLNCLSSQQLELFFKTVSSLLLPGGKLIVVIMPKQCLWEQFYFSLKGDFKKAKRRKTNQSIPVNVNGVAVDTWYYNPEDIVSLCNKYFTLTDVKPIGLTIPPSYLENSILAKQPFLPIFKAMDRFLTGRFWAKYADHILLELTNSNDSVD